MIPTAVNSLGKPVNKVLSRLGLKLVRHDWSDPTQYIPFAETLARAKAAGLPVGDYIDLTYNVPGAAQATIDRMGELGVFTGRIENVLEIGPGSGRYLERTIRKCSPARYEIYETAESWARYLEDHYPVARMPTSGSDLSATPDASIDLVHAHKVFGWTPFLITCRYWLEMLRVARHQAHIVFDIVTEDCMSGGIVDRWIADGHSTHPAVVPRAFALEFFGSRGAALVGSFFVPMKPGKTETFVFRKTPS